MDSLLKDKDIKERKTLFAVNSDNQEFMKKSLSSISAELLTSYCSAINDIFMTFYVDYDDDGVIKDISQCKPVYSYLTNTGKRKKSIDLAFLSFFFADSRNFGVYMDMLSEKEKEVWKYVVDNFFIDESAFRDIIGKGFYKKKHLWYYSYRLADINESLLFFYIEDVLENQRGRLFYYAVFGPFVRSLAYDYFYPGKGWKASDNLKQDNSLYLVTDSEQEISRLFLLIKTLYNTNKLTLGKAGRLLQAQRNMAMKQLEIKEYFPHSEYKEQSSLRTQFMITPLLYYFDRKGSDNFKPYPEQIKAAIEEFIEQSEEYFSFFLPHMKGLKEPQYFDVSAVCDSILEMLKELPEGWVSVDTIIGRMKGLVCSYYFYTFYLMAEFQRLKIENKKTGIKLVFGKTNSELFVPFVKAFLLMLNSLGALDVAINEPQKTDKSFVEPLRYIRLTAFGRYVCGQTEKYTPVKLKQEKFYELDSTMLVIRVLSDKNPFKALLDDVATYIGANRYKVTADSFLKNCVVEENVEERIDGLKGIIDAESLPPVWQNFFTMLRSKHSPMKRQKQNAYRVYKVNNDDKDLLHALVTDNFLKQRVVRAEGFMILIKKENVAEVMQRLKHFGYVVSE